MGHLLRRAREVRQSTLMINLVTGAAAPEVLLTAPVHRSAQRFAAWLPDLVRRHFSDMKYVSEAAMTITFDLSTERPNRDAPDCRESPFVIRVDITDDRGKVWTAEQRDWWFSEPPHARSRPLRRFGWLSTLHDKIRRYLFGGPLPMARVVSSQGHR